MIDCSRVTRRDVDTGRVPNGLVQHGVSVVIVPPGLRVNHLSLREWAERVANSQWAHNPVTPAEAAQHYEPGEIAEVFGP